MRLGFWIPWWFLPFYLLAWICFLPFRILLAIFARPRRRDRLTIRVRIQERENAPAQPEG